MSQPPLVSPDVDLRDFAFMPLDVVRLRDSDLSARASGEAFRCAVLLWCASWHQEPAASLPDDDVILANLAGFGRSIKDWKKQREGALHGWIKCSDGRLYHPVVAEKALEAWESKLVQRWRTECARIRKYNQRHKTEIQEPSFAEWKASGCPIGQTIHVPWDKQAMSQGHFIDGHGDNGGVSQEKVCEIDSKGQGQGQGQGKEEKKGSDLRSGAVAPAEQADALSEDPKKILFSSGLTWLRQLTGQSEPRARTLLGKMLSDVGGDQHAGLLLGIFRDAKREDKSDQIAWIHKMIHSRSARAGPKQPRRNPDLEAFEMLTRADHERNQQNQESSSDSDAVAALAIFGDRARSPSGAY